jgi:hypothetical protein
MSELKPGQPTPSIPPWRHPVAVVLGIAPAYGLALWMHLSRDRAYTLDEMLFYPLVFTTRPGLRWVC